MPVVPSETKYDEKFEKDKIVEQSYHRYIDIDENTMCEIRVDVLWIEDVDSDEILDSDFLRQIDVQCTQI